MLDLRRYLDDIGVLGDGTFPIEAAPNICKSLRRELQRGSGKTTTAAHLAQHLALAAYRVLAIDLDPQASMSALHGFQPELDVGPNETIYGAIRYDDQRRPLRELIKPTNFPGLDIVPGNIELMSSNMTLRWFSRARKTDQQEVVTKLLMGCFLASRQSSRRRCRPI